MKHSNSCVEVVGASPCGHMAGHLCSTWHLSISVRTSITRSEFPIRSMSISSWLHCVSLGPHNAFRIGFLTHSHEQSFSSCQKYTRWDVTLSSQATCYTLHHVACRLRWKVNHQVIPYQSLSVAWMVIIALSSIVLSSWLRKSRSHLSTDVTSFKAL